MNRALVAAALWLILLCGNAYGTVLFYDDAEDYPDTTYDWGIVGAGSPNSLSVSAEQARAGSHSYKFVVAPYGTSSADERVELILRKATTPKIINFQHGTEYWMGWSVYIPADTQLFEPYPTNNFAVSGQFHASPDACDNLGLNPTAGQFFRLDGVDGFRMPILGESAECSTKDNDRFVPYYSPTVNKGAWNDIVLNFRFDYDASPGGFFKAWLNGVLYKNAAGADMDDTGVNCWNDTRGPYFKLGLYIISTNWNTLYIDEFRVADGNSSYADVAPGGAVAPEQLTITTSSLGTFTQSSAASGTLAATGGTSPYTWSSANKPSWFTLTAATGAWSASPTEGGVYAFTITCTDADLNVVNKTFSGTITEVSAPTLPEVTAFVMPDTSTTLEVPVTTFTGTAGTAAYIVTESPAKPVVGDPGWSASAPASATASDDGMVYFYGYVKDGDGVISVGDVEAVDITIDDSVIDDWTETATANVWSASCGITALSVYFDSTQGNKKPILADVSTTLDWFYTSSTLYTYSETDPDSAYTEITAYTDEPPTPVTPAEAVLQTGGDKSIETGGERTVNIR